MTPRDRRDERDAAIIASYVTEPARSQRLVQPIAGDKKIESIALLLARLFLLDLSRRPAIRIEPAAGVEWIAYAFFGEKGGERTAPVPTSEQGWAWVSPRLIEHGAIAAAKGKSPDDAVWQLLCAIASAIRQRILADVGAFELALGERFDFGLVRKADPHADEPIETSGEVLEHGLARRG